MIGRWGSSYPLNGTFLVVAESNTLHLPKFYFLCSLSYFSTGTEQDIASCFSSQHITFLLSLTIMEDFRVMLTEIVTCLL